jgi:hypothetical protein
MRSIRNLSIAAPLIAVTLSVVPNAAAQCAGFRSLLTHPTSWQPTLGQGHLQRAAFGSALGQDDSALDDVSIVGLWHVVYTAGGEVFFESLDQWHSDGTEFENAFVPVAGGNICFGVWKWVGTRTVRLHHVGWTYDATTVSTANGTFTLNETNTVSKDGNTYTGDFTYTPYDLKGNPGPQVKGTIKATRITVQ